ncbi:hypothetical protein SLU01_01050 [Sporosarcina luteola]|uniref:SLH domain-containing protein n=1 Tax=Sporosarcina luteola TaxID=582850 RepID=A0A511Z2W6_9BACL|nr:S-layer homology domain-containing protein [Sporosarcina luteola]GEN81793.1 hypothetical protein SLU01_01050 [Sporosarcina luteola]
MGKFNRSNLFKATLATTLATGAIVAFVPANAEAATRTFSDVKDIPSHHFYEAVMDLSSRGIIGGYPDGTFKPGESISRQHAAKFLALTLGLDTVNVKDPGFKDVNKNNPYYSAIAALVEKGIISGYADNTFKPNENLTRTQMAKMLVLGFNLKSQGTEDNPFSDISAGNWNKSFVQVLYSNDITSGTTPTTFSPNAFVTRGQLASFLFRSEAATGSKPVPEPAPEVTDRNQLAVEAAYFQVTGGTLEIPHGDNATNEQKLTAVQTYATSLIKEQGVVAKVVEGKRTGLYVVTFTKGGAKTDKTIAMKFESKAGTHYIKDVKALNAKQVEVTFATPISKSTILDARNVVQNISITANTGATGNPGQLTGALSSDGRTLTITASGSFNGDYTLSATDAIQSTTNEPLDKYAETLKAYDTTAPRLVSSSAKAKTSTTSFSLFFDEPVNAAGATVYVNNSVATITNNPTDPNRLDITARTPVQAGATARISVTNVKDYNNNTASPNPVETTITVAADTTSPTVIDVRVTTDSKIELTYDKDMDISSFAGKARIVHANGAVTELSASAGRNARTVVLTGASSFYYDTYNSVLFIDADVKDTAGYSTALYSTNLNFNLDRIPPALTNVEWKNGEIIASFSESITLGTNNVITVVNQNTGVVTPITLNYYGGSNTSISYNSLTVYHDLPDGYYQLHVPANTVVDQAPIPNPNEAAIQAFTVQNYGWDTTPPVVSGIANGPVEWNSQTVTYTVSDENSGVNLDSVRNILNYTWGGQQLPEGSTVSTSVLVGSEDEATYVIVTVYVPSDGIPITNTASFTVSHIRDNTGNTMYYTESADITFNGYQH